MRLLKHKPFWSLLSIMLVLTNSICMVIYFTQGLIFYIHSGLIVFIFLFLFWFFRTPYRFLSYSIGYPYQYDGSIEISDAWCKANKIIFHRNYGTYFFLMEHDAMAFKLRFTGKE